MKEHQIKIISGELRGRNVKVVDSVGLRPTPNRVRETLFNWLMLYMPDSKCLDLFAGSGILGFEAISRGAKSVTFVEKDRVVANNIRQHIVKFNINQQAKVLCADYRKLKPTIQNATMQFDVIFLDPPYDLNLLPTLLQWIKHFNPSLVYIEDCKPVIDIAQSADYTVLKQQQAGQVYFALIKPNADI